MSNQDPDSAERSRQPRGFPDGYNFRKGDWLCPSPGCEGFVTAAGVLNCSNCGRAQPHPNILTLLASDPLFRCGPCRLSDCPGKSCAFAHAACELRQAAAARKLRVASAPVSIPPPVTTDEMNSFCMRWGLGREGSDLLSRFSNPLVDAVLRTFSPETDGDSFAALAATVSDYSRPQLFFVSGATQMQAALCRILGDKEGPVGVACSPEGNLAVAQGSDVFLFQLHSLCAEECALLYFALTAWGVAVVHGGEEISRLQEFAPADLQGLVSRVRRVISPSEISHVAPEAWNALADRAVFAKADALLPVPSQSPSPQPSPLGTPPFR